MKPAAKPATAASGCLITKWAAIWQVHADGTRSYVQFPSFGCDQRAHDVVEETLDRWPKAGGGEGAAYLLNAAQSEAACKLDACGGPKKKQQPADDTLPTPARGWGNGVADDWMGRSTLRFNGAAQRQFGSLRLAAGEPLLLVFGGASVSDMLRNWAIHVQKLTLPFAVACMDVALFELADGHGLPGVMMAEGALKEDGATMQQSSVTTRWKYFRMDPKAFMTMGILKVKFFMEFLRGGFDVLCADLDVLWLRDPRPWVLGAAAAGSSRLLAFADVVVSTDVTSGANDNDAQQWGVLQEMNTGMLLLHSSAGAMALCRSWVERMQLEMVSIAKLPPAMLQWWSNDQTFFNEVVHRARPLAALKAPAAAERAKAAAHLRETTAEARRPLLEESLTALEALRIGPGAQRAAAGGTYADARGVMIKRYARGSAEQVFSIATFPFELFASGHTYFTQSLQPRRGFVPVAVHTTFQFGDTAEFAWGKRSRLRERLLWKVDKDDYFTRSGGGDHPSEAEYRGFLHLAGDMRAFTEWMANGSLIRSEAAASVKLEGRPAFIEKTLKASGDVLRMAEGNPNRHLLLDSFQRRLVHAAMALGRATKRKVIMPRLYCWSDRYWNNLERGRFPGVSSAQHPFPFHCPFDHLYDLEKWVHSEAPFREYSFLDSPRVAPKDRADAVEVRVRGSAEAAAATTLGATVIDVDAGSNYAEVGAAIKAAGKGDAYVVRVDAHSLSLLCEDLGSSAENAAFNKVMHRVLGIAEQVRYCDADENRHYNGRQDDPRHPINCTWGFVRPPLMGGGRCQRDIAAAIADRRKEQPREWSGGWGSSSRERWSTRDRPGYLYREFM